MLGKLMKYEFKATGRIFLPLFGSILVMAAVTQLLSGLNSDIPRTITMVLSSMLITTGFVVTLILTIQRFYKNLLGAEGYLMHTLPVSTGRLIFSKLLAATLWVIVCIFVTWLAVVILSASEVDYRAALSMFDGLSLPGGETILYIAEFAVVSVVAVMSAILCLYACMALSMLFEKHRVAISFGFFIAISTVVQIVAALLLLAGTGGMDKVSITVETVEVNGAVLAAQQSVLPSGHAYLLWSILIAALLGAGFYAITHTMLKRRLNLQ